MHEPQGSTTTHPPALQRNKKKERKKRKEKQLLGAGRQWLTPIIPATWEAEIKASPGK
jgi:hypothetical protein